MSWFRIGGSTAGILRQFAAPRRSKLPGFAGVALLFIASPTSATAALTAWKNASVGNWDIAANWNNNVLPNASTGAIIANGGTALLNSSPRAAFGLYVGVPTTAGSTGTLLVDTFITLTVGDNVRVGGSTVAGFVSNGTLTISGGALVEQTANYTSIGDGNQGSTGTVTVTGEFSTLITTTALIVGTGNSHGTVNLQNGGVLGSSGLTAIAETGGSTGSITVTGADSAWYSSGGIFVGGTDASASGGTGALHILNGGWVRTPLLKQWSTGFVEVDNGSASTPGLLVTGTTAPPAGGGSLGDFAVGNNGTGRMEITAGGQLYTSRGFMGGNAGSNGTALLSGTGSEWSCNGSVYVGNSGEGYLTVDNGALLSSAGNGYIAFNNNTVGYAIVSNGGRWNTTGTLYIGGNVGGPGGSGTLLALNGTLNAGAYVIHDTGGVVLSISALLGPGDSQSVSTTINGGYIQAGGVYSETYFGNACTLGTGGVRFYTAGKYLQVAGALTGSGGVTKGGSATLGVGILELSGTSTYTGPTFVSTGTLLITGSITSPVTVNNFGRLIGHGSVGSVTLSNFGSMAPGEIGAGKLTINGNYTQTSGGVLEIDLLDPVNIPASDQLAINGSASVGGTLKVKLYGPAFRPPIGTTYSIITCNGLTGNFATINSPGLLLRSDASPTGIVLTVLGYSPSIASTGSFVVSAGPNGVVDPGETVTVSLGALNNAGSGGGCTTAALTGTLQPTDGVTDPSGPQTYSSLCPLSPGSTRTFTFTVDPGLACGEVVTASLAMTDGAVNYGTLTYSFKVGSLIPVALENFDGPIAPALPNQWTTTATGALTPWVSSTTTPSSLPNAAFVPDLNQAGTSELISPPFGIPAEGAQLEFRISYNTERIFDGMVLEISINGDPYLDIIDAGGSFLSGGYSAILATGNPLSRRPAWTGNSMGYVTTVINLPIAALGQSIQLKWLMATDSSNGGAGGWIDDVSIGSPICGGSAPLVTSAVSRKVHGASGAFDIALPLTGAPGVECRTDGIGGSHQVVVTFASPVSVSGVSVASADGLATGTQSVNGAQVTIDLAAVANAQTLGIMLAGVNDGKAIGDVLVHMGVLLGDTTGNGAVTTSDIGQTKGQSGQAVTAPNFRSDVTANGGSINTSDIGLVKSKSGTQLPP